MHGIKLIGHKVKSVLPMPIFKFVLLIYHKVIGVALIPCAYIAKRRVDRAIERIAASHRPIRFGFYVVLESMFQWRHVFELMLKDARFEPFIVVIPRVGWQDGDMVATVEKSYRSLVADYGEKVVKRGLENGEFHNFLEVCDACAMMSVYRGMSEPIFEVVHFGMHGVPVFTSPYGYHSGDLQGPEFYGMPSLRYLRRMYFDNEVEKKYFEDFQSIHCRRDQAVLAGCPKSDVIAFCDNAERAARKTILLCPHHSVIPSVDSGICVGNFLKYKDLFLALPKRYPDIHWIFRPHPHLRLRLTKDVGWPMTDWDDYIKEWVSNDNAEYEDGGSYYESFAKSDAIIEDCCSFLPEYFYTGKPLCYMLDSVETKDKQFDAWGHELLAHTYEAFDEVAIIRFIEEVVVGGNDTMREMRLKFAKERVMINYPHASEFILEDIAGLLGRGSGK